ncbi:MAG: peroxidase-related enzyme [Myxococcota bacterium]
MSISRFPVATLQDLPDDLRARIEPIVERSGFVPNIFLALAHRPAELRAFLDYHDALMERDSGLTKAEREMIVVATSAANDCLYCVVAHGAILRIRAKNHEIADRIAANWRTAPVSERQRAMLTFAVKLALRPAEVEQADLALLEKAGFTQDEVWDMGSITSLFAMSNRLAHMSDLQPNPEFFRLGRG